MSVLMTITGLLLVLVAPDATAHGIGIALILTVQGAWFISGSARQVAHEMMEAVHEDNKSGPLP